MAVKKKVDGVTVDSNSEQDKAEAKPGFSSYLRVFTYADNIGRGLYAISFIAAIAAGTCLPLMNIVFGSFVTTFTRFAGGNLSSAEYMQQVDNLALYFIYLFIAKFALTYIHTVCVSLAAIRTTKALRVHFLQSVLRQEISFFESKDIGSPSIKVTTNGNIVNNGISEKLTLTISNLALFFSAFVVAFVVQWKLTLITIGIIPVLFVAVGGVFALDAPIEARVMAAYTRAALLAEEIFSTIPTVHAFWLQPLMAQRYDSHLENAEREGMKKSPIFGVLFSTSYFCVYSGYGLAFWQGTRMYVSGEITEAGKIVTVIFALVLAATSVQSIAFQTMVVSKAVTAAGELFAVIDRESAIDPQSGTGLTPDTCRGNIEVRDLCFAYPSRPDSRVLDHLTLDLPANETTALVGASGSGKSTIVGLLERWYDYPEGAIHLDGVNIRDLDVKWLRTKIRLVQQEPVLFSGTVFDNVCHGLIGTEHESVSDEHKMELVRTACQAAFAHDFIEQLPNKYFSELGERARMLSGGQKQRIAIARAIISNPPVLLLDEATSALDPRAEEIVQKALDNVSKSRTTLVIAHKLSTVQKADNIAVMAQGAVIEQGTSGSLMELNGAYARLVRAQNLEQGAAEEGPRSADVFPGDNDAHDMSDQVQEKLAPRTTNESSCNNGQQFDESRETLFREGMDYSLLKCLFLLIREQRQLWPVYFVLGVASLCAGGTWPVLAILFSRMFVTFQLTGSAAIKEGNFWALMFFVVALANFATYFTIGVVANIIAQKVTHRYRLETFNDTIRQDLAFFDQETNATGAITSRLSTCPNDLTELLGFNSGIILNNVVTVISCAILGIAYGWKLGLVCTFAALPPMLICGYARIRLESKLDDDTVKRFASSASLATEAVSAMRTVASLTLEPTVIRQYEERLSNVALKSGKALVWTMFWYSISQSINFLAMVLGFWYGGKLVSTSEYSTGQFFTVFIAIILGGESAAQFFQYSTSITKAQKAANYVFWLRYRIPTIGEEDQAPPPFTEKQRDQPASITCDAVKFAYPSRPHTKVLKGIHFRVPAGSFVAFVGTSGCGKSSLINLLARYYDPTAGVIAVNDQSIAKTGLRQHRRMLALVQQEPVLYSGSVRENVAMGAVELGEPTEEQIEKALRDANILDFSHSLPEGLQTSLGYRGAQLSGGQKQRIALARALIRDPKILLLDESTSALDTESEQIVQAALMEAAKDGRRSTIAVAHRLSTVKDADTIYVVHAGRIVETGTHGELIAKKGVYYDMAQGQALDGA